MSCFLNDPFLKKKSSTRWASWSGEKDFVQILEQMSGESFWWKILFFIQLDKNTAIDVVTPQLHFNPNLASCSLTWLLPVWSNYATWKLNWYERSCELHWYLHMSMVFSFLLFAQCFSDTYAFPFLTFINEWDWFPLLWSFCRGCSSCLICSVDSMFVSLLLATHAVLAESCRRKWFCWGDCIFRLFGLLRNFVIRHVDPSSCCRRRQCFTKCHSFPQ